MQTNTVLAIGAFSGAAFAGIWLALGVRKGEMFMSPQVQPNRVSIPVMFWLTCGTLAAVALISLGAGASLLLGFG